MYLTKSENPLKHRIMFRTSNGDKLRVIYFNTVMFFFVLYYALAALADLGWGGDALPAPYKPKR